ncbi:MAG: ATPase domain-containing protein, partial [archaeon]
AIRFRHSKGKPIKNGSVPNAASIAAKIFGVSELLQNASLASQVSKTHRLQTGISGMDNLMEGGIPEKSLVLLSGSAGTGKTIFAFQWLVTGALANEPGVYVAMEEDPDQIVIEMERFGWPIRKLIKDKKLIIIRPELYKYDLFMTAIEDAMDKIDAKRLVVDSMSVIGLYFENPYKVRRAVFDLNRTIKRLGVTTMVITEIREGSQAISTYGVEEYVADGVIVLYYLRRENMFLRAVAIRKMRYTDHSNKIHPIKISDTGITVYGAEEIFASL